MKRVAIYGRHSSELSDERSSEDQINYCREFAARNPGWMVTHTFRDEAISGSSFHGRPGAEALLRAAQNRAFDIILAEHPDRISRSTSDLTGLYDRCDFLGIEIWGVNTGKLDTMSAGMHGIMAQAQREEIARKVYRGMKPKAAIGRHMGGLPYGYRAVISRTYDLRDKGKLEKVLEQVAVIIRIFNEYLAGKTPRDIAYALNVDGIPSPRGGKWNASTINGQKSRGLGILNNPIYVGRLTWNRLRMKKVPGSASKRISQPRPKDDHISYENPELRILSDEVFNAVQGRRDARSHWMPTDFRKAKRLLSGKLRCGGCGSGMSSMGKDKTRKTRIGCSRHAESKSCPDPVQVYLDEVEKKVVDTVLSTFSKPDNVAWLMKRLREDTRRAAVAKVSDRAKLERRQGEIEKEIEKLTDLLMRGIGDEASLDKRIKAAASERKETESKLAAMEDVSRDDVVEFHPAAIRKFVEIASELRAHLERRDEVADHAVSEAFRAFITDVTVTKPAGCRKEVTVTIRSPFAILNHAPDNRVRKALPVGGITGSGGGI